MKKRLKTLCLACLTLILLLSVTILVACNDEIDPNEFVTEQGNTVQVILDSLQDPLIKDGVDKVTNGWLDYRIKPDSPIPQPGVTPNTTAPVLAGFIFDGYYEGEMNDDGTVTYGEKWDFTRKVSEPMTLYGKWIIQYRIRVNFVLDGVLQNRSEDVLVVDNTETVTSVKDPSWSGNTFVQIFTDAECTEPLIASNEQPFTHGCTQDNPIREVYAQFIEGSWTLVKTASDLKTINPGSRLYFMNDIDMSSMFSDEKGFTDISVSESFSGVIEGNGHTISNLHYFREGSKGNSYTSYCIGLFAQVTGATIRNITFENCSVSGSIQFQNINGEYLYGFIAGRATKGNDPTTNTPKECVFEDITFVNCECELKLLQFNIPLLTPEQNEAEKAKVEHNFFIGQGSDYQPIVK